MECDHSTAVKLREGLVRSLLKFVIATKNLRSLSQYAQCATGQHHVRTGLAWESSTDKGDHDKIKLLLNRK